MSEDDRLQVVDGCLTLLWATFFFAIGAVSLLIFFDTCSRVGP